jgi:hypothetical protein
MGTNKIRNQILVLTSLAGHLCKFILKLLKHSNEGLPINSRTCGQ